MPAIRSTVTALRTTAARHRTLRSEQRRLERELAEYRTDAERLDLAAVLARHTAEEITPIERIFLRQTRPGGLAYRA
jgi:hypothetical protein